MKFLSPAMLLLLLAAPALIAAYVLLLRRRKRGAVRYSNLSLVKEAIGPGPSLRRHLAPLLLLLSVIAAIIAVILDRALAARRIHAT